MNDFIEDRVERLEELQEETVSEIDVLQADEAAAATQAQATDDELARVDAEVQSLKANAGNLTPQQVASIDAIDAAVKAASAKQATAVSASQAADAPAAAAPVVPADSPAPAAPIAAPADPAPTSGDGTAPAAPASAPAAPASAPADPAAPQTTVVPDPAAAPPTTP